MRDNILSVDNNVTIISKDYNNRLLQKVEIHNKSTRLLTEGLLRFLEGDFTPTEFNKSSVTPEDAKMYIPTRIWLGTNGIVFNDQQGKDKRVMRIDSDSQVIPYYNETDLENPISRSIVVDGEKGEVGYIKIKKSQFTSDSGIDTERLVLTTFIPTGVLVGTVDETTKELIPYEHTYWSPYYNNYCANFTEVGLFSSTGSLLSRVLLDGKSSIVDKDGNPTDTGGTIVSTHAKGPLFQLVNSTISIEWRIKITSVSSRDTINGNSPM